MSCVYYLQKIVEILFNKKIKTMAKNDYWIILRKLVTVKMLFIYINQ